jgi:hypothetical protein
MAINLEDFSHQLLHQATPMSEEHFREGGLNVPRVSQPDTRSKGLLHTWEFSQTMGHSILKMDCQSLFHLFTGRCRDIDA